MDPVSNTESKPKRGPRRRHSERKRRMAYWFMLVWTLATLAAFILMMNDPESVSMRKVTLLIGAALLGVVLCLRIVLFTKK